MSEKLWAADGFALALGLTSMLALLGCAAPPPEPATASSAPRTPPATSVAVDPAPEPAPEPPTDDQDSQPPPALPAGANGPSDAVGLIGEAGQVVTGTPDTVLLVNSARIRAHPSAESLSRVITGVLAGWSQFMPTDLIDPIHDVDWVLMAGTLIMGSTQNNVFVARYNVSEPRADEVSKTLLKRLPKAREARLGVKGAKAITAHVDGAERAFVRARPGILAIVPAADGKRAAELFGKIEPPRTVREGELLRFAVPDRPSRLMWMIPPEVKALRVWMEPGAGAEILLHAEGDCEDGAAAERVVEYLQRNLEQQSRRLAVRLAIGALLERTRFWQDGRVARMSTTLHERDLRAAALFTSRSGGGF
jgi:hypothetical protein